METIRVVLADDHPVVRQVVRCLLERAADIAVVGEAASGEEALRATHTLKPNVVLLDMELPGLSGPEVVRRLRGNGSPTRVLAMGTCDDVAYILGVLEGGATGYLTKKEIPDCLSEAIRAVAQSPGGWLSPSLLARLLAWTPGGRQPSRALTRREADVLRLVAAGRTNRQIARALGISVKTVEKHLAVVFAKLGAASRAEAAVHAVRRGLL